MQTIAIFGVFRLRNKYLIKNISVKRSDALWRCRLTGVAKLIYRKLKLWLGIYLPKMVLLRYVIVNSIFHWIWCSFTQIDSLRFSYGNKFSGTGTEIAFLLYSVRPYLNYKNVFDFLKIEHHDKSNFTILDPLSTHIWANSVVDFDGKILWSIFTEKFCGRF